MNGLGDEEGSVEGTTEGRKVGAEDVSENDGKKLEERMLWEQKGHTTNLHENSSCHSSTLTKFLKHRKSQRTIQNAAHIDHLVFGCAENIYLVVVEETR